MTRLFTLLAASLVATAARGDDSLVLSQEGFLLDASDQVVSTATPMTFRIVDHAATDPSDVVIWSASCTVQVRSGFYAVQLGDGTSCGTGLTASTLPFGVGRWLEVVVDGAALAPRLALTAAPTAGDSARLAGKLASSYALKTDVPTYTAGTGLTLAANQFSISGVAPGLVTSTGADTGKFLQASGGSAVWASVLTSVNVSGTGGLSGDGKTTPLAIASAGVTNAMLASDAASLAKVSAAALATNGTDVTAAGSLFAQGLKVAGSGSCAGSGDAGNIRYSGGHFQGCNGSAWVNLEATLLDGVVKPCATGGFQVYSAATGTFSACPTTWNCTTQPSHPGCVSANDYATCLAIKQDPTFNGGDGSYWIHPDASAPFQVTCDMTNGGWTLLGRFNGTLDDQTLSAARANAIPFTQARLSLDNSGSLKIINCADTPTRGILQTSAADVGCPNGSGWYIRFNIVNAVSAGGGNYGFYRGSFTTNNGGCSWSNTMEIWGRGATPTCSSPCTTLAQGETSCGATTRAYGSSYLYMYVK